MRTRQACRNRYAVALSDSPAWRERCVENLRPLSAFRLTLLLLFHACQDIRTMKSFCFSYIADCSPWTNLAWRLLAYELGEEECPADLKAHTLRDNKTTSAPPRPPKETCRLHRQTSCEEPLRANSIITWSTTPSRSSEDSGYGHNRRTGWRRLALAQQPKHQRGQHG